MPTLFLIPTPLGAPDTPCLLPHEQAQIVGLTDFVVEAEKTARAHLKHLGVTTPHFLQYLYMQDYYNYINHSNLTYHHNYMLLLLYFRLMLHMIHLYYKQNY